MPKPYSFDLRQRAIALVASGQSRAAVARLLSIGKSTVILWARDYRATGKQAALPMSGRRRFALLDQRDWLLARVAGCCLPNRAAGNPSMRAHSISSGSRSSEDFKRDANTSSNLARAVVRRATTRTLGDRATDSEISRRPSRDQE